MNCKHFNKVHPFLHDMGQWKSQQTHTCSYTNINYNDCPMYWCASHWLRTGSRAPNRFRTVFIQVLFWKLLAILLTMMTSLLHHSHHCPAERIDFLTHWLPCRICIRKSFKASCRFTHSTFDKTPKKPSCLVSSLELFSLYCSTEDKKHYCFSDECVTISF